LKSMDRVCGRWADEVRTAVGARRRAMGGRSEAAGEVRTERMVG
jgi:hypothetical protein